MCGGLRMIDLELTAWSTPSGQSVGSGSTKVRHRGPEERSAAGRRADDRRPPGEARNVVRSAQARGQSAAFSDLSPGHGGVRSLTVTAGAGFASSDCIPEQEPLNFWRRPRRTGCAVLEVAETVDIGSATHGN